MTTETAAADGSAAPPTGFLTFLFSDIEGSTQRWVEEGNSMVDVIAEHDQLLRWCIEERDGYVVKFTGDGVMAAFRNPDDGVAAAIEAQRSLQVPVRMGLHCGSAIARNDDYFGVCVNRTARLMGVAHGGQIVVSQDLAPLLTEIDILDLGVHQLKDMPGPETVYQVLSEGLRGEFPPLTARVETTHNLPAPSTPLIGRAADIDECSAALGSARVVTIVGAGGLGKTRLATEVARNVLERFPDGVFMIELAPVSDAADIPDVVRRAMGRRAEPGRDDLDEVIDHLAPRTVLLVLDNCDHLIEEVRPTVESILAGAPQVKVLATSRGSLAADGERVVRPDSIGIADAVDLFVQRAQATHPSYVVDDDEARSIEAICSALDCMPLAVELAAAQTVVLPAATIVERLGSSLDMSGRHRSERHRSLRDTVAWSVDLLDEPERELFRRLAVLRGSAPLDAVELIGEGPDAPAFGKLTSTLSKLVDVSLVEVTADRRRYRMLEPVRQYAEELLIASPDEELARGRHAAWIRSCVAQLANDVMESRLEIDPADLANIRAAGRHLIAAQRYDELLQLIIEGEQLWVAIHFADDLHTWLHEALDAPAELPLELRVHAAARVAGAYVNENPGPEAISMARLAVDLAEEGTDEQVSAEARFFAAHNLADAYMHDDAASAETREWCDRAVTLAGENPVFEMYAHSRVAIASFLGLRPEEGLASANRNAELAEAFGLEAFVQLGRAFRAPIRAYLGDEAGARDDLAVLRHVAPSMSPAWQSTIHSTAATAWERLGDYDEMSNHLVAGLRLGTEAVGPVVAATLGAVALRAPQLPPELVAFGIGVIETYHSSTQPRMAEHIDAARARATATLSDEVFSRHRAAGTRHTLDESHQLVRRALLGLDWSFPDDS